MSRRFDSRRHRRICQRATAYATEAEAEAAAASMRAREPVVCAHLMGEACRHCGRFHIVGRHDWMKR